MGRVAFRTFNSSDVYLGKDTQTGERVAIKRHKMKEQDKWGVQFLLQCDRIDVDTIIAWMSDSAATESQEHYESEGFLHDKLYS